MEQEIKALFNEQIIKTGAVQFGVEMENLTFIGAWQNFIYEYEKDEACYILRFTPSSHRSKDQITGELDWILYLAKNGISVSKPIRSTQGKYTELIYGEDTYFTVASFVKAEGNKLGYPECLHDNQLYQELGRMTGKMHALSKSYKPQSESTRRHDWTHNYYLQNMRRFVPLEQSLVHESSDKLIKRIKDTLSKSDHCYGLIHGDIGVGNFVVNNGDITLFDFDEAQYSWFIEDIAIQLYYLVYVYGGEEGKDKRVEQAHRFMSYFLRGYTQYNTFEEEWLKLIPLFLQLREIIVYTGMYRSSDLTKLNPWARDYLSQSKERIEKWLPIVNIWT
ncbi:phosphotransferase [Paenibacillus sp. RC67]|uniref:phosphotransferase enzyme family protein n=1 Tax=Paenibacillus sp. RC67 TaxID=3039392 RepID=UPI0024AD1516|nr:phosphotransferase [Paenibacillus sp. RC67]